MVCYASASLFPARKLELVHQGRNHRDRPSDAEDNPRGWYRQRLGERGRISGTLTQNKNNSSAGFLNSNNWTQTLPAFYIYFLGGWGSLGSVVGGVRVPTFVLFLFYVNVSRKRPRSRLYSQSLTVPAPRVILRVGRSIPVVSTLVN